MQKKKKDLVLHLENVYLEIPIVSKTELSLKKTFMRSVTGGGVSSTKTKTSVIALDSINLNIYSGERIALIGHNGAGKTSFLKLVSGIYEPTQGVLKKLKFIQCYRDLLLFLII